MHDVDAGCRNPDRWHPEGMTVGFSISPENFFQKISKKVKGICVSCIIESETANIQHKTARYINAAGGADKLDCATPSNDIAAVHNVLYIAEYFV